METDGAIKEDGLKRGPSFVGVGPEKTGTTWLYRHLNENPQTTCSPVKELRYFWENMTFPRERFLSRIFNVSSWHTVQYRSFLRKRFRYYRRNPKGLNDRKRLVWDLKYLFSIHDDEWYLSSFDNSTGLLSGEISPQYFFLPETEIVRISRLLPETKFIISLRYPPEWAWSFARMMVRVRLVENTEEAIEAFIASLLSEKTFSKNIRIWQQHIPENQLKIIYFDQLQEKPYELYQDICDFLEIDPVSESSDFTVAVNAGKPVTIPERFRPILSNGWKEEIAVLKNILPDLPDDWLTRSI
jgi:hypothetical protein